MPRPNPPRKRARRRPGDDNRAARADAALNKQTAQSAQPRAVPAGGKSARELTAPAPAAAAAPAADDLWTRRSYAILFGLIAVLQVPIAVLFYSLQGGKANLGPLQNYVAGLQLFPVLIACYVAMPVARFAAGERRPLRFLETLIAGILVYFIWELLATAAGVLLVSSGIGGAISGTPCSTPHATPLGNTGTSSSASATPCPTTSPSPSPSASPSPSPTSASSTAANTSSGAPPAAYAIIAFVDLLSFVLGWLLYPPLYKRLRMRRPPPRAPPKGTARAKP